MNQRQILVCTVGGSDKPIVTALQGAAWDHVVFVCKERSALTLTDPIETTAREGEATRPPIPEQVALEPERWSSVLVPPDDPDAIYTILIEELDRLRAASPSPDITIDFTGGTKSMSAGAVLAVAARPGLKLQVTSGQRSDLVRVIDGTQRAIALGTDRIAMDRQIAFLRETWSRFGYQEVAEGFEALVKVVKQDPGSVDDAIVGRLKFWAAFGRGFAAWDRFDRKQAARALLHPLRKANEDMQRFGSLADSLCGAGAAPLVLFDLLRNAERCAARGRNDDAVARCYRLWEWTVQWLLEAECGIKTAAVDPAELSADLREGLTETAKGVYQIGSDRAWKLYRQRCPESEAAQFWNETNEKTYSDHAYIRNYSILAHGEYAIGAEKSTPILTWTAGPFMDMVRQAARRLNQADDMPQLPRALPEPTVK